MGPRGFGEFHRYYKREVDRLALIIDVRWNGGGHVSQLLLEKLARRRISYDKSRWMEMTSYPMHAPLGRLRGREHFLKDGTLPLVVTYHPAYLLRSPSQKAKSWQDLCAVRRILDERNT